MPQLEGRALELYEKHFGQKRYQDYNKCRTDKLCKASELPPVCMHQPCHDVESYFWMIALFLSQAIPDEDVASADDTLAAYQEKIRVLQTGAATRDYGGDCRNAFLMDKADYYRRALHPGLAKFAPLIAELAIQILPEWEFLSESPPADHLHEAFRRILLKWITDLDTSRTPFPVQSAKRPLQDPCQDHLPEY